ncbi:MAG: hypothetical protein GX222_08430 [Ruminococcaceae bacterium]|nr:hypothetical protein [Oscillospiraceae bacterium]
MQKILFEDFYGEKESYLYEEGGQVEVGSKSSEEGRGLSEHGGSLEGMTIFEEYDSLEGKGSHEGTSLEGGLSPGVVPEEAKETQIRFKKPDKNTLREGIILSEILGPPRARRKYSNTGRFR